MRWSWDDRKFAENLRKHGLDFITAQFVFQDDLSVTRPDSFPDEERWQTIGMIGEVCVLVIHTLPEREEDPGRIISARRATRNERKDYEEGRFQ
jgi:uncharacterized protein